MLHDINKIREAFRWTIYLRVISQVLTWLASLLVIRFLTPEDFGIVALTEVIFMFVMFVCSSGLGDSLIQEKHLTEKKIKKTLNFILILTSFVCASLFISAPQIAILYKQPELASILRICAFVFFLTPWLVIASSILSKNMEFKYRGQVDLLSVILSAALSLTLAINGFGFWSLIISNLVSLVIKVIGYTFLIKKFYTPLFDFRDMYQPFKFGITVTATSIIFGLFMKIDVLVIGRIVDSDTLGLYALAMHLALLPMVKIMPLINQVSYPMYANIKDDPTEYKRIFFYMLRVICFVIFPTFYIFSAVAAELVNILLGDKWTLAILPLQIILLTIPFRIISNLFSPLIKALGFAYVDLQHISFSCVIVALTFYFAAPHGITVIATAWFFATPIILTFAVFLLSRKVEISYIEILKTITPPVLISVITYLSITQLDNFAYDNHFIPLALKLISGLSIYLMLSWFFNKNQLSEFFKFRI